MAPSVYDMVNNIYKAFMSDLYDENDKKEKNRIRKKINRLVKEEGSLSHDVDEICLEYNKLVKRQFKSKRIIKYLDSLFKNIIKFYQDYILNNISILNKEDVLLMFWRSFVMEFNLLEIVVGDTFIYDENNQGTLNLSIIKDNKVKLKRFQNIFALAMPTDKTCFYRTINLIKQYLSIKSDNTLAYELGKGNEGVKVLYNWRTKHVIPNSFLEIKDLFLNLFKKYNLSDKQIDEFNYILYISIAFSHIDKISKEETLNRLVTCIHYDEKVRKPFIELFEMENYGLLCEKDDMKKLLEKLLKYPGDAVNKRKKKKFCEELEKKKSKMDSFKHFYIANYYYYCESYFEEAKYHFEIAFNDGRYCLGPYCKILVQQFMHCCKIENDKKTFNKVYNWNKFIAGSTIKYIPTNKELSCDEAWRKLHYLTPIIFETSNL